MSIVDAKAKRVYYSAPAMVVEMEDGSKLRFPVSDNPRLSRGNDTQLNNVEISPFGLHWPDLDEDLSLGGLRRGDFGQRRFATARVAEKPE
jgi:hypothetical protein